MRAVGISYNVELQKMLRMLKRDVDATIIPIVRRYSPTTLDAHPTFDGWADDVNAALDALLARWLSPTARASMAAIASRFVRSALGFNTRTMRRTLGVDLYGTSNRIDEYLKAASAQNARLITSIAAQYHDQVSNIVAGNMRQGMRPGYIVEALHEQFGVRQRHTKMIARDQSAKITGELNKLRQQDAGYKYFKWVTSHDQRVRDRHREIADKVTAYGVGVYRWDNLPLSDKGVPIQPGSDYQCFPGTSPVNVFYGAKKAFRHWYSGELTTLVTESGKRIVCTPNHPVLTDKGFVAADSLNVGDQLVHVVGQPIDSPYGNADGANITFSKLFETCELLGILSESVSRFGSEFHGDIAQNEEISVVSFDWELPHIGDVSSVKSFFELFFAHTDMVIGGVDVPTTSDMFEVVRGLTFAPDSIVRSACQLLSFVSCGFTHPDEHRLASVGLLYSRLIQDSSDYNSGSVEFFGDCFDTNTSVEQRFDLFKRYILAIGRSLFGAGNLETPGADRFAQIVTVAPEVTSGSGECITLTHEFERIVDKSISVFSGHVYNLEMGEGLFVSHSFAVSNCRCIAVPVSDEEVERNRREWKTAPGVYR